MTNKQRNKLLADELRALADLIETEQSKVVASVTIEPDLCDFMDACEAYVPTGTQSFYGGSTWFEQYALDETLRIRVKGGDA
jgi:hypothetical protein